MKDLPYHHLPDGTFRNPEGSPKRDENIKWSFKTFNKEYFWIKKIIKNIEIEKLIYVSSPTIYLKNHFVE